MIWSWKARNAQFSPFVVANSPSRKSESSQYGINNKTVNLDISRRAAWILVPWTCLYEPYKPLQIWIISLKCTFFRAAVKETKVDARHWGSASRLN